MFFNKLGMLKDFRFFDFFDFFLSDFLKNDFDFGFAMSLQNPFDIPPSLDSSVVLNEYIFTNNKRLTPLLLAYEKIKKID